jgi:sugar (pentulose or hexulose) kinase
LKANGRLPADSQACFIMDYFGSVLTSHPPITEPSCAGSSGVFNVRTRQWDDESIRALELPRSLFPEVREAHERCGLLTRDAASATGLSAGTPVFAPIGDHQASFLGSVVDRHESVLVNVGTGAQVAVYTEGLDFTPPVELRPFPGGGNLLSNVGLAGGWSYQVLQQFFRDVGQAAFAVESSSPLYEVMNRLAAEVAPGADGLRCEPLFSGTRLDPTVRGSITGLSPHNFTARHLARAVLEGMARSLHEGYVAIQKITGRSPTKLIAAGNGLRENPLLASIVSETFGLPIRFTEHREEAAYGAALSARNGIAPGNSIQIDGCPPRPRGAGEGRK